MNYQFYIGQKVVAVKDGTNGPIRSGEVCTVSDISICPCGQMLHIEGKGRRASNKHFKCDTILNYGWQAGHSIYFRPLLGSEQESLDAIEKEVNQPELIEA